MKNIKDVIIAFIENLHTATGITHTTLDKMSAFDLIEFFAEKNICFGLLKKGSVAKDDECPVGLKFGIDFDYYEVCTYCDRSDNCEEKFEQLKEKPTKKPNKKPKKEMLCPHGHVFVRSFDEYNDCTVHCDRYHECKKQYGKWKEEVWEEEEISASKKENTTCCYGYANLDDCVEELCSQDCPFDY